MRNENVLCKTSNGIYRGKLMRNLCLRVSTPFYTNTNISEIVKARVCFLIVLV